MKRYWIPLLLAAVAAVISACRKEPLPEPVPQLDEDSILAMVPTDVQNTAYYKDIFLDGGCELNPGIKENGVVKKWGDFLTEQPFEEQVTTTHEGFTIQNSGN